MEFAPKLAAARQKKIDATINLAIMEQHFAAKKAQAEIAIIEDAGGIKELGSNVEMQNRELTARLDRLPAESVYQTANRDLFQAKRELLERTGTLDCLLDARRDFENALRQGELTYSQIKAEG